MADFITIPRPDDMHVHLRQGPALEQYTAHCAEHFGRALVMPNTLPPIRDAQGLTAYKQSILDAAAKAGRPEFKPLMTFKVFADQTPDELHALKEAGAVAGKLYPQGATTNSNDGVSDVDALWPVFKAMEELDLILCLHGEDPKAYSLKREAAFLPVVARILADFPRLRVILEHVTSAEGIAFVLAGPETLGCTITVHHLLSNLDHMVGDHLNPHLFCKPILKSPDDQLALQQAALSAPHRVFYGSDSAPHPKVAKECDCGAAGVYTMPVALSLLAGLFVDGTGMLPEANSSGKPAGIEALIRFVAGNGHSFYGLTPSRSTITLEQKPWTVPANYGEVVPYRANTELTWSVTQC